MARKRAPVVGYTGAPASGTLTAAGQSVALAAGAAENVSLSVWGTFSGALFPEATLDDAHWFGVPALAVGSPTSPTGSIAAAGLWQVRAGGFSQVRLKAGPDFSGSAAVLLAAGAAAGAATSAGASTLSASATLQSAQTGNANGSALTVTGYATALFSVTGTFTGTVNFEALDADGNVTAINASMDGTSTVGTTATAAGLYRASVAAFTSVRARTSGMSAGSVTVKAVASNDPHVVRTVVAVGAAADGAAAAGNPARVAGWDGTNARTLKTDANGQPLCVPAAGTASGATQAKLRNLAGSPTAIKTSPGTLYDLAILNTTGAAAYVQLFDLAVGSVTPGTTQPLRQYLVPANSQVTVELPAVGLAFATAITAVSTTTSEGGTGSAGGVMAYCAYA